MSASPPAGLLVPAATVGAADRMPAGLPSCALVDLDAIAANVARLRCSAPGAQLMAVVKADGYGHGMVPAARAAVRGGADWLGVAQLGEALELRRAGLDVPVLAWITVPGDRFADAVAAGVDVGVGAAWTVDEVVAAAARTGTTARVHLKVDTGLGRGGCRAADLDDLLGRLLRHEAAGAVRLVGMFSHLACADTPSHPSVAAQVQAFTDAVRRAERAGARLEVRHLANSAGTLAVPGSRFDLVRPGIAVYGLSPVPEETSAELGLRPAMSLLARVALVKDVPAGQGVSYGLTYTTPRDTTLAVVPVGYGDGLPRHAGGTGPLLVAGRRVPIAGRVCMDQVVVDLGSRCADEVAAGDVAVLFGTGQHGEPTAQDWALAAGTINYEIVTRIGVRVPRSYTGTGAAEAAAQVGSAGPQVAP